MSRVARLFRRAKQIYHTEGFVSLVRRGLAFLLWLFFEYRNYWLYEHALESIRGVNEADFMPRIDHFDLKVVSSNNEADQLEAEGFEFRSRITNARERLYSGAIAFCIFVGQELANIGWVALSQRAKDSLLDPPFRVDFPGNEACGGSIWTKSKYRRKGFRLYNRFKRFEFLLEKGIVTNRSAIAKNNIASLEGYKRFPATRAYAEGRYLRILWWKSWKERPLP